MLIGAWMNRRGTPRTWDIGSEVNRMRDGMHVLGYDTRNLPTNQFFNLMYLGELTAYETIRRIRAKLQSEDESFRGKRYLQRANKKELIQVDLFNFDFI